MAKSPPGKTFWLMSLRAKDVYGSYQDEASGDSLVQYAPNIASQTSLVELEELSYRFLKARRRMILKRSVIPLSTRLSQGRL